MAKNIIGKYYVRNNENGVYADIGVLFDGVAILTLSGLSEIGEAINVYTEQWLNEPSQKEDFLITSDNGRIIRKNVDIVMTFAVSRRYSMTNWAINRFGTARCQKNVLVEVTDLSEGQRIVTNPQVEIHFIDRHDVESVATGSFIATTRGRVFLLTTSTMYVDWQVQVESSNGNNYDERLVYDYFVDYMTRSDIWLKTMYYKKAVHCYAIEKSAPEEIRIQRGDNSYMLGKLTFHAIEKPEEA